MSSVSTPRALRTSSSRSPKSSPTGPTTRTPVKKLAASEKCTADPPSIRSRSPNGVRTESNAIEPTTVSAMAGPGGVRGDWVASLAVGRRYVILASVAVLVLALTVPAVGKNGDWFGLADRASKNAKTAKKKAKKALKKAKKAKKKAKQANRTAKRAKQQAGQTDQALNSTKIVSDRKPATVTTSSESYVARGGPRVTVTVPQSGLIEVWAQFNTTDADGGAVSLYE